MAKIMTIDDSPSIRKLVAATLTQLGHQVVEAANGAEALKLAQADQQNVIVCDVNMPVMDGISFVKALRALPKYKFTPVLMLTTELSTERKQEAKAAGATGWIVKPFNPEQLAETIRRVL